MSLNPTELRSRLEAFLTAKAGAPAAVTAARHLTGGASRETWAVDVEIASGGHAAATVGAGDLRTPGLRRR